MWRLGGECDKIGRRKFGAMHRENSNFQDLRGNNYAEKI